MNRKEVKKGCDNKVTSRTCFFFSLSFFPWTICAFSPAMRWEELSTSGNWFSRFSYHQREARTNGKQTGDGYTLSTINELWSEFTSRDIIDSPLLHQCCSLDASFTPTLPSKLLIQDEFPSIRKTFENANPCVNTTCLYSFVS